MLARFDQLLVRLIGVDAVLDADALVTGPYIVGQPQEGVQVEVALEVEAQRAYLDAWAAAL